MLTKWCESGGGYVQVCMEYNGSWNPIKNALWYLILDRWSLL